MSDIEPTTEGGDANTEVVETVECRICGNAFERKPGKLIGHIGTHQRTKTQRWNKAAYLKKYGKDAAADFTYVKHSPEFIEERTKQLEAARQPDGKIGTVPQPDTAMSSVDRLKASLTMREQVDFQTIFDRVFQQIDRDEAQIDMVASFAFNTIHLNRLREKQFAPGYKFDKNVEEGIAATEKRLLALAEALAISREQKLKAKVNIKSTPAALIAGYIDEIERVSPEALATLKAEEDRVVAIMRARIEEQYVSQAAAPDDESATADGESHTDTGDSKPPSLDAILRRASINS